MENIYKIRKMITDNHNNLIDEKNEKKSIFTDIALWYFKRIC